MLSQYSLIWERGFVAQEMARGIIHKLLSGFFKLNGSGAIREGPLHSYGAVGVNGDVFIKHIYGASAVAKHNVLRNGKSPGLKIRVFIRNNIRRPNIIFVGIWGADFFSFI